MLNRVCGNKQCDESFQRGGHRIAVQFGVPPGSQPNSIGIRDAVHRLIAVSRTCNGPEIEFCDDLAEGELRPMLQLAVLFIVRELMLNAMHHSRSKRALVGIAQDDECLFVQVQDWGVGFDPASVPLDLCGLEGIRDLVRWLGGNIDIDSQPGAGTCVVVEVPLSQETAANHPISNARSITVGTASAANLGRRRESESCLMTPSR